jgi:hypothetical protein
MEVCDLGYQRSYQAGKEFGIGHSTSHTLPRLVLPVEPACQGRERDRYQKYRKQPRDSQCNIITVRLRFVLQPAIKLLEFFRGLAHADTTILHSGGKDSESGGLPKFDTKKVQSISPTINRLEPIGAKDAERWVRYWNAAGLFD